MSRPVKRPRANHDQTAASLRRSPGIWQRVSTHRASSPANNAAHRIRTAYGRPCYEPAGAFEAEVHVLGDDYVMHARWLGPQREAQLRRAEARTALGINDQKGGER